MSKHYALQGTIIKTLPVVRLRKMFNHIKLRLLHWLWRRDYLEGPKKLDVTLTKRKGEKVLKPGNP